MLFSRMHNIRITHGLQKAFKIDRKLLNLFEADVTFKLMTFTFIFEQVSLNYRMK